MPEEERHIERIDDTRAALQANLDILQIAIETDNEEHLVYKDDGGNYRKVANLEENAEFLNIIVDEVQVDGDIAFDDGENRLISIDQAAEGTGDALTVQAGKGEAAEGGGALNLFAGQEGDSTTITGSVAITGDDIVATTDGFYVQFLGDGSVFNPHLKINNTLVVEDDDFIGSLEFWAIDDGDDDQEWARIGCQIIDASAAAESANILFYTVKAGTITKQMTLDFNGDIALHVGDYNLVTGSHTGISATGTRTVYSTAAMGWYVGNTLEMDVDASNITIDNLNLVLNAGSIFVPSGATVGRPASANVIKFTAGHDMQMGDQGQGHDVVVGDDIEFMDGGNHAIYVETTAGTDGYDLSIAAGECAGGESDVGGDLFLSAGGPGGAGTAGGVFVTTIKSGATQGGAGAAANELWKTDGHATLPDDVVLIGV